MADFQNRLISRISGAFSCGFFAQNNSSVLIDVFRMFLAILILDPN